MPALADGVRAMTIYYLRCNQCNSIAATDDRAHAQRFLEDHHRHTGAWAVHADDIDQEINLVDELVFT